MELFDPLILPSTVQKPGYFSLWSSSPKLKIEAFECSKDNEAHANDLPVKLMATPTSELCITYFLVNTLTALTSEGLSYHVVTWCLR